MGVGTPSFRSTDGAGDGRPQVSAVSCGVDPEGRIVAGEHLFWDEYKQAMVDQRNR